MAHADTDTLASIRKAGIIVGSMLYGERDESIESDYVLLRAFSELRAAYFQATGMPLQWVREDLETIEQEWLAKLGGGECPHCANSPDDPHAAAVRYQKHHA